MTLGLADRSTDEGSGDRRPPTMRVKQLVLVHGKVVSGRSTVTLGYEPEEALALVMRAKHKGARVQEIAAQLRAWSTS